MTTEEHALLDNGGIGLTWTIEEQALLGQWRSRPYLTMEEQTNLTIEEQAFLDNGTTGLT